MKKKSLLLTTLITTLGVGVISVGSAVLTHASVRYYTVKTINRDNLPYHATTQRSAYVYNVSHTRRLHNLKNYPNTTWYVSKSLLMRSSYTGRKAVYYYVTSGNGRASGIVWRGYLTDGVNSGTSTAPNAGSSSANDSSTDTGSSSNTSTTGSLNSGSTTADKTTLKQQFQVFLAMPQQTAETQIINKVKQDLAGKYTFDTNLMNYADYSEHYAENHPDISDPDFVTIETQYGLNDHNHLQVGDSTEDYGSSWFADVKYDPSVTGNSYVNAFAKSIEDGIIGLAKSHPDYPKIGFGINIGQSHTYTRSAADVELVEK
ncbi:hypothetical protein OF387_08350 [Lentilactobacillus hilgardii]|nr:hypothetical protein [Lentilactobacillus hilgardii]MCV3741238.1 hypothetical protein [Lentilactobacillus hilgardii]